MDIRKAGSAKLPTEFGEFTIVSFEGFPDGKEHIALVYGDVRGRGDALVRIHSECLTGDAFGSLRCDCGPQLHQAMRQIVEDGAGVIAYLRQEGRGIGLVNKIRAYALQDKGMDTVEANLALGFEADARAYEPAVGMLNALGVGGTIRLLTNNPDKVVSLSEHGFEVVRVPIVIEANRHNAPYLRTKARRMGHQLVFTS